MSTSRRTLAPRTPGVASSPDEPSSAETDPRMPEGDPDPEGDERALDSLVEDQADVQVVSQDPPTTAQPQDIKAYIDQQIAAGVAAALRKQHAPAQAVPAAELPDQRDVDPDEISRMVLTKQGYVMPTRFGATPKHLQNLDR